MSKHRRTRAHCLWGLLIVGACSPADPEGSLEYPIAPATTTTTTTIARSTTTVAEPLPTAPVNAIGNGGAEVDTSGWNIPGNGTDVTLQRDTKVFHSGKASFRLTTGKSTADVALNDAPNWNTTADGPYCRATLQVRGPVGTEVAVRLREYVNDQNVSEAETSLLLRDEEWHEMVVDATVKVDSDIDLTVRAADVPANSSVWIDDIDEICTTEPTAPSSGYDVSTGTDLAALPTGPVVVAAGEIACENAKTGKTCGQERTAAAVAFVNPTRVLPLGNLQYGGTATAAEFQASYGPFADPKAQPSWGDHKAISSPTVGSHEYDGLPTADGYFEYWNGSITEPGPAGIPAEGWYAEDIGTWRVLHLNSQQSTGPSEAQNRWLAAELAAAGDRCTLVTMHRPRYSSGPKGNDKKVAGLFTTAYAGGADVVLSANDNIYERFAPQDSEGNRDDATGVVQFVVGTGGVNLDDIAVLQPNSEYALTGEYGVLRLILVDGAYDWAFISADNGPVDNGQATCHDAPAI